MGACPQRVGIGPEASRCDVDAGPTVGPGRRHLHRRRRHLRHQPRRHAALALRHRRPRLVGARRAARRHGGGGLPGRPRLRHRAQRAEALGLPRRRRRRGGARRRRRRHHLRRLRRPQALRAGARRHAALGVHHRRRRARVGRRRQRRRSTSARSTLNSTPSVWTARWPGPSAPAIASCRRRWSTHAAPSCSARRMTAFIVSSLTAICAGRSSSAATSTARRRWPRTAPSSWAPTTASSTRCARRAVARRPRSLRNRNSIDSQMTLRAGPASRACRPARSRVGSRFTPPGTASSSPTTSPRTSTSRPATAAPPWTPTRVEIEAWPGVRGVEGRVAARARARARQDHRPARARAGKQQVLQPDDPRIAGPGHAARAGRRTAPDGQAVVAEITRYPDVPDGPIEAAVLKVLGDPDDPRTEVEKMLACADVDDEFPDDVARIADGTAAARCATPTAPTASTCATSPFTTIDPETARDFDDAVAIETLPHGGHARCGSRSPTSRTTCARARRSTPRRCGAAAASTCPTAPSRCCPSRCRRASARWSPRWIGWRWWCASISTGTRRSVDARLLRGGDPLARAARLPGRGGGAGRRHARQAASKYEPFLPGAARAWTRWRGSCAAPRIARGALDFDLPEPIVELDDDDPRLVRDVRKSRRDPGERQAYSMIEEFMLAANEAVARSFHERGEDTVWRIHDAPDRARLEEFAVLARALRHRASTSTTARTPQGLQAGARPAARGTPPRSRCRSCCCARSSRRPTTWSTSATSAWPRPTTCTSPRRSAATPTSIVHRLLKSRLAARASRRAGSSRRRSRRAGPRGAAEDGGRVVVRRARARWRPSARWSTSTARSSCATGSATCSRA